MAKKRKKIKKSVKKSKKRGVVFKRRKKAKKTTKKRLIRKAKPRKKIIRRKTKKVIRKSKPKKKIRRHAKVAARKRKKPRRRKRAKIIKPRVYIGKGILEQLLESQVKVKLLKFFFRNSKDMFQLKEVFRRLRSNAVIIRRELKKLEDVGIVKQKKAWLAFETKRGGIRKEKRTVYYLNPGFDFLNELRNLILKSTISSKDELVNNVRKLGNIKVLLLAGIFTADDTARVDLLIVGDKINSRKLNTFLKDLEAEVGKELNCAIMTTKEFNYRYDMYDRFVRDLLNGKSEILINRVNLW